MKREYPLKPEKLIVRPEEELLKLGVVKGYISLSKDGSRITYTASGRSYNFKDPEEKIRAQAYIELVEKYKYDPKRMDQEISPPRREPRLPADIVVYEKKRDRVFIVVETKAEETDKKIEEAKREGLGNANLHNARYLWIVCGTEKFAYDVYEKPPLDELQKHRIADIPIAYGKEPKFKYKKADPEWDLSPITFNELGRKFQLCHDEIWEGGKRDPAVAFDEMSKLMFIKIWDERFTEDGKYYRFQIGSQEEKQSVAIRIKDIYKDAQEKEPDVFKGEIELPDRLIYRLVEVLQDFSFTKTDLDAKGRAFEKFLGMVFRGQFGQYFTRREIVEFMVDMLEPTKDDIVIDPACGSGGFLLYTMDRVRKRAKKVYKSSPRTIDEIYWNFPRDSVFGIDNNDRIARVAMMDMVIHDDGHTNIENNNALFDYSRFSPKRDIRPSKYTLLMTNPPFGAKETNLEILKLHELGSKIRKRKSQRSEVLFIERCLNLLRTGGRMGIVLPDGILTNSSLQYVRGFIERKARILAVVSLPRSAFVPAGAGVKASLLFLKKKNYDGEDIGNYPIFMVTAEHIGYDATGRPDKNELPEILKEYKEFLEGKTEFNPGFVVMKEEIERRWDPFYYSDFRKKSYFKYPQRKLVETCDKIFCGPFGTAIKSSAYVKRGVPFVRITNIRLGEFDDSDLVCITKQDSKRLSSYILNKGDLIVSQRGTIGNVCQIPDYIERCNISANTIGIRPSSNVNSKYLLSFLISDNGQTQFRRLVSGHIQNKITTDDVKSIIIPLAPREVQDKIANIMEEAYRKGREKLVKAKEFTDSIEPYVLRELGIKLPKTKEKRSFAVSYTDLKRGLRHDPFFYKPKYKIIEEKLNQGRYPVKSYGEMIRNIINGLDFRKFTDAGVSYLRVANIKSDEIDETEVKYVPLSLSKVKKDIHLKAGDVLLTRKGTFGVAASVKNKTEYIISSEIFRIRLTEVVSPSYFVILNNSSLIQKQIKQKAIGAIMGSLSQQAVTSIRIPLPPFPIQEKIAKEVQSRREQAKKLKEEAAKIVEQAKEKVERIILGKKSVERPNARY